VTENSDKTITKKLHTIQVKLLQGAPKLWYPTATLHGVTIQKTET